VFQEGDVKRNRIVGVVN